MFPAWSPHWDVWAVVAILAYSYFYAETRLRAVVAPTAEKATRSQWYFWYAGVAVLWLVSDWPIHELSEETLFTAHMLEHLLIGYVIPPLLLTGMPRWMADVTLGNRFVAAVLRPLARPVVAFFVFNVTIVFVHWPEAVGWQNSNELVHFSLHAFLFATGVLLWLPIFSPTPAIPRLRRPMQMLYLFLNTIIPTVPASFITFSREPLYTSYGDAAAAWGLTPLADQTIAGITMKLGGGFYLLGIIAYIWVRWTQEERKWDAIERDLVS